MFSHEPGEAAMPLLCLLLTRSVRQCLCSASDTNLPHEHPARRSYIFTTIPSRAVYASGADEKKRKDGTRCESSHVIPATFHVGEETPCWQPAAGHSYGVLGTFYSCGNLNCIKVVSPFEEYARKKGRASLFTSLGSCFLSTGLTMCGVFGAWVSATKKRELNKAVQLVEAKPNARAGPGAEATQNA